MTGYWDELRRRAGEIPLFTAMFDSQCSNCGNDIVLGDRAGYVDDEVCCEACVAEANE